MVHERKSIWMLVHFKSIIQGLSVYSFTGDAWKEDALFISKHDSIDVHSADILVAR